MRIFFSVGEPSGDLHGANLIRALRDRAPEVECVGYGGPKMAAAGCLLHAELTNLAVIGFVRVIASLHHFLMLASRADRYFRHQRPDAVVLIDYPGFNWWIARRAKAHGIPVFYYTPPQIWAWATYRVKKMRQFVDHVLCSLPFEEPWFRERGCNARFIGHPYFDEMRAQTFDETFAAALAADERPLVVVLPGSRTQEVRHNLPTFLNAVEKIRVRVPQARFAVAAFRPHQARWAEELVRKRGLDVDVHSRRTPELIRAAHCCLACSGSVSLELLYHRKPTVIGYRIGRFGDWFQYVMRRVPYITLVNLLETGRLQRDREDEKQISAAADPRVVFPEFLARDDRSTDMADYVVNWLTEPTVYSALVERLTNLRNRVASGGASALGADAVLDVLRSRPAPALPRPHYLSAATEASKMAA